MGEGNLGQPGLQIRKEFHVVGTGPSTKHLVAAISRLSDGGCVFLTMALCLVGPILSWVGSLSVVCGTTPGK